MQRGFDVTGRKFPMFVTSVICLSTAGLLFSVGQNPSSSSAHALVSAPQNPFSALVATQDVSLVATTTLHDTYDVVSSNMSGFQRMERLQTSPDEAVANATIPTPTQFTDTEVALHPQQKVQAPVHKAQPKPSVHHTVVHLPSKPLTSRSQSSIIPSSYGSAVANYSQNFIGTPYVWGGSSPRGFDCSGFVEYTYQHYGIHLGHSSYGQFNQGTSVSRGNLSAGDLVFFDANGPGASHVGIYLGGGQFISAAGSSVRIDSLSSAYWGGHYVGARRIH
jgi:cell wall-associated NlpC family hydrolase